MSNIAIKELAWKSGICARSLSGEVDTNWRTIEKFALDIVNQCCSIAIDADEANVHGAGFGTAIAMDIKEHFGL